MAHVVAAVSMSHAPLMVGAPDAPAPEVRREMETAISKIARYLDDAKPDVVVAFLDDHFENHYRRLMPTFSIGVAASHHGPADYWMEALRFESKLELAGAPELAEFILGRMVREGFDVARMGSVEYGNNLMAPWKLIRPQNDIAVIPVFTNVFTPPLTTMARAYAFGAGVRDAVDAAPGSARVALLATGGLSHWPPIWLPKTPQQDAFMKRMRRFQSEGRPYLLEDPKLMTDLATYEIEMARTSTTPLVNAEWDRRFLAAVEKGDRDFVCGLSYEEIEAQGGHGGHEVLNWCALMGAMRGKPATVLAYEPVTEWICGMGFVTYAV